MEYRFFTPSRPDPADWSKLDIWQAASDQHRIFKALKKIYSKNWISTGGSKGGMTATYYERFYPRDMDGVVAYVAPNDVVNKEDSAYDRFFAQRRYQGVPRPAERRAARGAGAPGAAGEEVRGGRAPRTATPSPPSAAWTGRTRPSSWTTCGASGSTACWPTATTIPADAKTATDDEIWNSVDTISGFSFYTDQGLSPYTPYYYQAGTQLGAPDHPVPAHREEVRPLRLPAAAQLRAALASRCGSSRGRCGTSTRWVRHNARPHAVRLRRERPVGRRARSGSGKGAQDAYVFTAPGPEPRRERGRLVADEKAFATARILDWAGVAPTRSRTNPAAAKPLAKFDAKLDKRDVERRADAAAVAARRAGRELTPAGRSPPVLFPPSWT